VLFNSWGYVAFMLVAVPLMWLVPHGRARMALLCGLSLLFYSMWRWEFTAIMIGSASVDWVAAARIAATDDPRARRRWLAASLAVNFGLLIFFKYTYFIEGNVRALLGLFNSSPPTLEQLGVAIVLPLGISFYTFKSVSYTVDVYRGLAKPIPSYLDYTTFIAFWPELVAGPILRMDQIVPQLQAERRFARKDLVEGLERILRGLFKKVVIADSIAPMVDAAFAVDPTRLNAIDAWVAAFLFGFQIYFDFAGYSDVAIGSARLLGFDLPENFDHPYSATSPREFWTRWHISLSSWIRDYLYLPLTGQPFRTQTGTTRTAGGIGVAAEGGISERRRTGALFLTWFIMGLWHGAAWTFALWGVYHATLVALYRLVPPLRELPGRAPTLAWGLCLPLSMAGWIFFRAPDVTHALTMAGKLVDPRQYGWSGHVVDIYSYAVAFALTIAVASARPIEQRWSSTERPAMGPVVLGASQAVMVCSVLVSMRALKQFIYFQF
jgi:alginate O-acetyltransferase complex protein AlgI